MVFSGFRRQNKTFQLYVHIAAISVRSMLRGLKTGYFRGNAPQSRRSPYGCSSSIAAVMVTASLNARKQASG